MHLTGKHDDIMFNLNWTTGHRYRSSNRHTGSEFLNGEPYYDLIDLYIGRLLCSWLSPCWGEAVPHRSDWQKTRMALFTSASS